MIFEGRILNQISDIEIKLLVSEHVKENQNLEYKLTINSKSDEEKFESLCDIVSLANVGGGYLIVGIRDDGKGKAQKFVSVNDPERIIQSLQSLCLEYISERIEGIECEIRSIDDNKIIIFRIPNSIRIPHMVTYQNSTHFLTRYNDGKREMTIGEIRSFFIENLFGRKLSLIEDSIKGIMSVGEDANKEKYHEMIEKQNISLLSITDGKVISEITKKKRLNEIGELPFFRISVTPQITSRQLINVDNNEIQKLLHNPPNQRNSGWNMDGHYSNIQRFAEGIIRSFDDKQVLLLLQNGHMEFSTIINDSFCWNQSPEEYIKVPRLYPYPVIEYPLSFLKLYKEIINRSDYQGELIFTMQYFNIKKHILLPYAPNKFGFVIRTSPAAYLNSNSIIVPPLEAEANYSPDSITFELVKYVYASFGHTSEKIPFYNENTGEFLIQS